MTARFDEIQQGDQAHVLQTYRRQPVAFVRGRGPRLWDVDGREYLDFISGIGVASLGHANPGLAALIAEQASTLLHTSNLYHHPFQADAAARLAKLSGLSRVFFCNSGTEANEANLKFARRYWFTQGITDRIGYVALENGFAGRTMGALSVTHHYREPFMPLIGPVTFINPDTPGALTAAVTGKTAAIIVEPIRGEGGIRQVSASFSDELKDVCRTTGTLLIADEVQCGLGRTGYGFHFQSLGWSPDLVTVGKALGGGVPIGASLVSERVAEQIKAGDHGSTYGGNLLATRAASYVLEQIMERGLLQHVQQVGAHFERRLRALALKQPLIVEVRGAGLMRGVELRIDAQPVIDEARQRGLLVNRTDEKVVRMLPPLNVEAAEIDQAVDMLEQVLATLPVGASA